MAAGLTVATRALARLARAGVLSGLTLARSSSGDLGLFEAVEADLSLLVDLSNLHDGANAIGSFLAGPTDTRDEDGAALLDVDSPWGLPSDS